MGRSAPDLVTETAFEKVLCGVDDSRPSAEAARQAALLAAPGGAVDFVGVVWTTGEGRQRVSSLNPERVQRALKQATRRALEAGPAAKWELVTGRDPAQALLDRAHGHDLVAVGSHTGARASGILFGSVASLLVQSAGVPVLVARPAPSGHDFPARVVLATDGSPDAAEAVAVAGRIARARGSHMTLLHVADGDSVDTRTELAREAAELLEEVGRAPAVSDMSGDPHAEIARFARESGAELIVLGSRGLGGVKALGSVSERVAHDSPCSVLVIRSQVSS
jgi:nucleotide-binding universal stress UspA family protein